MFYDIERIGGHHGNHYAPDLCLRIVHRPRDNHLLLRKLHTETATALDNGLEELNRDKRQNEAKRSLRHLLIAKLPASAGVECWGAPREALLELAAAYKLHKLSRARPYT